MQEEVRCDLRMNIADLFVFFDKGKGFLFFKKQKRTLLKVIISQKSQLEVYQFNLLFKVSNLLFLIVGIKPEEEKLKFIKI